MAAKPPAVRVTFGDWRPTPAALLLLFLFFASLIISRRPDAIMTPQFWAEEGTYFFTEARERPLITNLASYWYGYFDVFLRCAAGIAAAVPLPFAPAVLVVSALLLQAAVPTFIVSSRCEAWLGNFPTRLLTAFLYCGMPDSFETHGIALQSRTHLAALAALVLVSPVLAQASRFFDLTVLAVSGLSGPFIVALTPVALWNYLKKRSVVSRQNLIVIAVTFFLTLFALARSTAQRQGPHLGATVSNLVRILGGHFTMGFFGGSSTYAELLHQSWFDLACLASFAGLVALLVLLWHFGNRPSRSLLFFGAIVMAMGLASPIGAAGQLQWPALWNSSVGGQRYLFLPMAMLLFALAAVLGRSSCLWPRWIASALLLLLLGVGVRRDWRLTPFEDLHFSAYARQFETLPAGSVLPVPINPPGWQLTLRKPSDR